MQNVHVLADVKLAEILYQLHPVSLCFFPSSPFIFFISCRSFCPVFIFPSLTILLYNYYGFMEAFFAPILLGRRSAVALDSVISVQISIGLNLNALRHCSHWGRQRKGMRARSPTPNLPDKT